MTRQKIKTSDENFIKAMEWIRGLTRFQKQEKNFLFLKFRVRTKIVVAINQEINLTPPKQ